MRLDITDSWPRDAKKNKNISKTYGAKRMDKILTALALRSAKERPRRSKN